MWFLLLKGFKSKGVHMIILNILRFCTLVGLASVMAASWALAIKINMDKPFFVFDAASLVFMSMIATFLFVSELPVGNRFFENNWPAFGPNKGIAWLGLALIMIGCNTLGKLNNEKTEAKEIGGPWYSLIFASGILNLIFGVLNILFGLAFGSGSSNARQVRKFGSSSQADKLPYDNASSYHEKSDKPSMLSPLKRVAHKMTGVLQRRGDDRVCKDTPPSRPASPQAYDLEENHHHDDRLNHRNDALNRLSGGDQDGAGTHDKPLTSPIAPNVMRPDSQQHPLYKQGPARPPSSVYEGPRYQHYSTASGFTQFPAGPYGQA